MTAMSPKLAKSMVGIENGDGAKINEFDVAG
jgi:hypothetical protein